MYTILRSEEFDAWFHNLRDFRGKARILNRIDSAEQGGDKSTQKRDIKRAKLMALELNRSK
ncbi:hypothetical protein BGZ96_000970 [Linnemannia gamsii]|uniref:Uncharacterized protein n=1 Tax=Linnemannia gamsii TaxID=64522 RepID=A0ABQ7JNB1_9FUNG|nr:hypothetical protein BGZ96_000970 [Linnemannia gamsii]